MSVDLADAVPLSGREGGAVLDLKELVMILDLHRQGLKTALVMAHLSP